PYAGRTVKGWPVAVMRRGAVIVEHGKLNADPGSGRFLARAAGAAAVPLGRKSPEVDERLNFGAKLEGLETPEPSPPRKPGPMPTDRAESPVPCSWVPHSRVAACGTTALM